MNTQPDIAKLRKVFEEFSCAGVVALIDYLASPDANGLIEIGSNTLDLRGDVAKAATEEERIFALLFKTQSFYLGSRDGSVTPLQSIAQMVPGFEDLPHEHQEIFDRICGGFAGMVTAGIAGPVESFSRGGRCTIEPEEFLAGQSERRRRVIN